MRRVLIALALLGLPLTACETATSTLAVKECADEASEANSPEQIRNTAEEKGVPELADAMLADAEEFKAYDWATCMMDKGWKCDLSGVAAPKSCARGGTSVQNPFIAT